MTGARRNVVFIMCDQLRYDYLSCYGHPTLETPNIDWLASVGVRFDKAYAQSAVCGPSRICTYTGRYMHAHGCTLNGVPLRVGEPTLGDHLKEIETRNVIIGKTHVTPDTNGIRRLGIDPSSPEGVHIAQGGFEVFERDDGLHPDGDLDPNPRYDEYLRAHGMGGDNPWELWANSAEADDGSPTTGWAMANAHRPARVPEEHSETPYITRRGIDFIKEAEKDGRQWVAHVSYIKPHWPYMAPAPYHNIYGVEDILPVVRSNRERTHVHPVLKAYQEERFSRCFTRDEVRERVIPCYMGLVKQIDDQMGVLFSVLKNSGLMENTMIVFTSDHGDFLGDHWLGEKYFFHEPSARVPLIIYDPDESANPRRGTVCDKLVELIDLAPTFVEFCGGAPKSHILEGRSLLALTRSGEVSNWRTYAFSEYDFSGERPRVKLGTPVSESRLYMVTDGRWKYTYVDHFRPMLFDLETDPDELADLGDEPAYADIVSELNDVLFRWLRRTSNRITKSDAAIAVNDRTVLESDPVLDMGLPVGYWSVDEIEAECERRAQARSLEFER